MIGLTNISEKILYDAKQEADKIVAKATAEAQELLENAKTEALKNAEKAEQEVLAKCDDIKEKARLNAQQEVKKIISTERQALISLVFENALQQLLELPEEQYKKLLVSLATQATSADNEQGELLLNSKDKKSFGKELEEKFNGKLKLSEQSAKIVGGLIIKKGKIEYNCALDVIVASLADELSLEVAQALFSQERV